MVVGKTQLWKDFQDPIATTTYKKTLNLNAWNLIPMSQRHNLHKAA